jgi:hypothetical protein
MIKVVVKELKLGDVEDPEIYLGAAAWDWLQTDQGAWVKAHAADLVYHQLIDHVTYGYKYTIIGTFSPEDALVYKLKWS